ncbi:MAG: AMP-binding protein [Deltaproteobacteria bacterium]|nr:AMP-binding protein [Deltaproteobacteria bacterium]
MPVTDPAPRFWNRQRETMSWDERRSQLEAEFLRTFHRAWRHSQAYREIFQKAGLSPGDIQSLEDLPRLPILRLPDLAARQQADPPFGGFEAVDHTEIHRIYVNPGSIIQPGGKKYRDTTWAEALCGAGIGPSDRVLNTFSYHLWPYAFMLDESCRMIGATVLPTGPGNTLMQVKILQQLQVSAFLGTPSFLMTLAQRAEGMGLDPAQELGLTKAMVGAEMLPESLRTRLQNKLGIRLRQAYGTVLLGCLGYECPELGGLHIPDHVIVELVEPHAGGPVSPPAVGEIVATCFNPVFPLLRLATGDLSLMNVRECACGRRGPMLAKVLGRVDQATKVRGTFIHPWQTDELMARYPEVFKYQVVITRENDVDQMTFWIESTAPAVSLSGLAVRLERDIKDMLTIRGRVKIVPLGTIPDFHQKIQDKRAWD